MPTKFKVGDRIHIPAHPEWPGAFGVIREVEEDDMYIVEVQEIGAIPESWDPGDADTINIEEIHGGAMELDMRELDMREKP